MEPTKNLKIHKIEEPKQNRFVSPGVYTRDTFGSIPISGSGTICWSEEDSNGFTISYGDATNSITINTPEIDEIKKQYVIHDEELVSIDEIKRMMAREIGEMLLDMGQIEINTRKSNEIYLNQNTFLEAKLKYVKNNQQSVSW